MALNGFAPSGVTSLLSGNVSSNVVLPTAGSPVTVLVTNLGVSIAYVLLGNSSVVVSQATGVALLPGQSIPLTIGSASNLAAISDIAVPLNVAVGT